MSSQFGNKLKTTIFGQSHGKAIGVVIDGLPAGEAIDIPALQAFMDRRRPGKNQLSTSRQEGDKPLFLSGLEQGCTCGSPLCAIIQNTDQHSADYAALENTPRPGHADYTAFIKWAGQADMRGGGHFSGRLTAPLCLAGGIAKQILEERGVYVGAHLRSIGLIEEAPFPLHPTRELFQQVAAKDFPVLDDNRGQLMQMFIADAAQEGDSVGGVIECAVVGLPAGLGEPMFDGVENRIAQAVFGIPAVKGLEFGSGFEGSRKKGSENNDPFIIESRKVTLASNNCGGILGGITCGMPLVFRVAMKPTPSISKPQQTVDAKKKVPAELSISGRHDPCIAHRAVPVVEAVAALVALDMLLEG